MVSKPRSLTLRDHGLTADWGNAFTPESDSGRVRGRVLLGPAVHERGLDRIPALGALCVLEERVARSFFHCSDGIMVKFQLTCVLPDF